MHSMKCQILDHCVCYQLNKEASVLTICSILPFPKTRVDFKRVSDLLILNLQYQFDLSLKSTVICNRDLYYKFINERCCYFARVLFAQALNNQGAGEICALK